MGSLDHQGVCDYEPILRFQQMNPHSEQSEYGRAGTFIRFLPDPSSAQHMLESIGIDSPEVIRDRVEQGRAYNCLARELRSAIRSGKAVPSRIAVLDSKLRIDDVADRRTSLERLHYARKVTTHYALCARERFARHHTRNHFQQTRPSFSVINVTLSSQWLKRGRLAKIGTANGSYHSTGAVSAEAAAECRSWQPQTGKQPRMPPLRAVIMDGDA